MYGFIVQGDRMEGPGEVSRTEIAIARRIKADSERLGEFMEDMMGPGNPYVTDEEGNWLTREEVISRTKGGWPEEMLKRGWDPRKVEALVRIVGR